MVPGIILTVIGALIVLALFLQAATVGIPVVYAGYYIAIFIAGCVLLLAGIIILVVKKIKSGVKKTAPKKGGFLPPKYFVANIVSGFIGLVVILVLTFVWLWLCDIFYDKRPDDIWGHINIIGLFAAGFAFVIASVANVSYDFSNHAFGNYHPTGRTIDETRKFVDGVYHDKGLIKTLSLIEVIFNIGYIAILAIITLIDNYAISILLPSPLLFIAISGIWDKDKYKEFIAEKSNCKKWEDYVCRHCNTLIPGKALVNTDHYEGESTLCRDTTTTTTTTTRTRSDWMMIGNTEYIDTYVDTEVNTDVRVEDYIKTDHTDTYTYRCPRCKKPHTLSRYYTTRTNI